MSVADWIVLCGTLAFIVFFGIWKSRGNKSMNSYLLADKSMPWYAVGISIMATQASAITFLSAPGQAFTDGMRFVQFYFGLPLAMIVLCITFVPIFHRLKVYTAYEFLENRFDLKTRALTAFLFLIQRGLACGLTIYAPSIILSSILGWNIYWTNLVIGGLVILYTVSGGTRAVSITQMQQMSVIFIGMFLAGYVIVKLLPDNLSFTDSLNVAGTLGRLNVVDFEFDMKNQYNIWSGLIGGFFLALSYFGTDQSQVGRYLTGKSVAQSRLGLLFNAIIKIPMQFLILMIGALLLVFYQFQEAPVHFNKVEYEKISRSDLAPQFRQLEGEFRNVHLEKQKNLNGLVDAIQSGDEKTRIEIGKAMKEQENQMQTIRAEAMTLMKKNDPLAETNDTNYIFLSFITEYFPAGLIGLLIAVIFSASMSSTSSELNALASTTIVDIVKRFSKKARSAQNEVFISRLATVLWGFYAILVAMFANQLGSLIEAVNKLGSLFYGTILGIFVVAFYIKQIKGHTVFYAAIIAEIFVIIFFFMDLTAFLWLNLIGCVLVIVFSFIVRALVPENQQHVK
ncbi:MAG: sodium:solute symporter [Bacteroidetes bacterium]|nr:MAG: sodium:solute symporter [Bacteroidota bacterium]REK06474.1 MAG: sodium:solute symporter [Bacteroidota bacterium]REK33240.1 MAG: sodium:solute symporter [Bacteroidota bacterium]REK47077.1 MAG: sodium:solute symporter [Bacteroidota bacterium]